MRVVAFALRAILIASKSLGENLNVFIADEIMFGVGFFALLYSAFTLVLDRFVFCVLLRTFLVFNLYNYREITTGAPRVQNGPLRILRDRRLFRIILVIGVGLAIMGTTDSTSSDPSKAATGTNLRRASTILFAALTVIQAVQTGLAFTQQSTRGCQMQRLVIIY